METFRKIVKNGVLLGAVGVLLALAAGPLAALTSGIIGAAGVAAAAHSTETVLWTGVFFGGFGALHAAVAPVVDWVFGADKSAAPVAAPTKVAACEHGHSVNITNLQMQPELNVAADVAVDAQSYVQKIEAQRAASAGHLQLVKS